MKVAIVTGGSKGIGAAIVNTLHAQHYRVYNLDITPSEQGLFCQCDVSKVAEVKRAILAIISQEQRVDVLVSNAGIHRSANIENTSEQLLDEVFALNVKGAFAATQAVLPTMREQQSGSIIYMASDQALVAKHNSFAYNLSKAALASMAKTTALDYAAFNIRANAVCPGTIETPLYHQAIDNYCKKSGENPQQVHQQEQQAQPLARLGKPQEVADLVAFLASDKAAFITGSLQVIDGGYTCQ